MNRTPDDHLLQSELHARDGDLGEAIVEVGNAVVAELRIIEDLLRQLIDEIRSGITTV